MMCIPSNKLLLSLAASAARSLVNLQSVAAVTSLMATQIGSISSRSPSCRFGNANLGWMVHSVDKRVDPAVRLHLLAPSMNFGISSSSFCPAAEFAMPSPAISVLPVTQSIKLVDASSVSPPLWICCSLEKFEDRPTRYGLFKFCLAG